MIHVRVELDLLRNDLRLREAMTVQIVAVLRRTAGVLGRLVRSIYGDGRSEWDARSEWIPRRKPG
jgi:hypothetical protein